MSDSEEFLSAEEDYDEIDDKRNSHVKNTIQWDEKTDLKVLKDKKEKENTVLETKKEINLKSLAIEKEIPVLEELEELTVKESVCVSLIENSDKDDDLQKEETKNDKWDCENWNELESNKKESLDLNKSKINTKKFSNDKSNVKEMIEKSSEIEESITFKDDDKKQNKSHFIKDVKQNMVETENIEIKITPKCTKDETIEKEIKKEELSKKIDKERIIENAEEKEDNWDFDDWGIDEKPDPDCKHLNSPKSQNKANILTKTSQEPKEDNWDFDDWGGNKPKSKESEDNEEVGWDDFGDDEWIATDEIKRNMDNSAEDSFKQQKALKNNFNLNNAAIGSQSKQKHASESVETLTQNPQNNASWNGWKPWGGVVTSFLSTATEGVTSLTTHVSHVLESSIGIPDPEELLKINQKLEERQFSSECEKVNEEKPQEKKEEKSSTLIGIVSGVTTIGNKVIAGGLDTLEGIGKKTMNILQENDPLLLNKRRIIGLEPSKPNLSQVLREAKEKSEEIEKNLKQAQKQSYKKQLHFETLFDHYYGLVHLEALEMLSKQCDIKLQSLMSPLSGKALEEMKETLNEVKELCELNEGESDEHDEPYTHESLQEDLKIASQDFGIPTDFSDLIECWRKNLEYLNENIEDPHNVFEKGLRCLAETCALQMNKMHKMAELLIIQESHSTANEADCLVQITNIFSRHLKGIANKFCEKLNTFEQTEEVNASITNIFLEVYNSSSYVQSAFKLFIPILQVGAA